MLMEGVMYMQLQVGAATKSMLQAVSASAWSCPYPPESPSVPGTPRTSHLRRV